VQSQKWKFNLLSYLRQRTNLICRGRQARHANCLKGVCDALTNGQDHRFTQVEQAPLPGLSNLRLAALGDTKRNYPSRLFSSEAFSVTAGAMALSPAHFHISVARDL
jgi:hypothetical protein